MGEKAAYARELANPMFAQQIETAKLKVAEEVNTPAPKLSNSWRTRRSC